MKVITLCKLLAKVSQGVFTNTKLERCTDNSTGNICYLGNDSNTSIGNNGSNDIHSDSNRDMSDEGGNCGNGEIVRDSLQQCEK